MKRVLLVTQNRGGLFSICVMRGRENGNVDVVPVVLASARGANKVDDGRFSNQGLQDFIKYIITSIRIIITYNYFV